MTRRFGWLLAATGMAVVLGVLVYFLSERYVVDQAQKRVRDTMLECRAFHYYVQRDMHPALYELIRDGRLPNFFYAPLEVEAWGGEVIYRDDGPPNSGVPFIRDFEVIKKLEPPAVGKSPCLQKVLASARMLKEKAGDDAPIIGVVMSPFSLPVMQMGFDRYIELMYERPDLFDHLMKINEAFCVQWANAQLKAGSTAICYFDPVSSTTISTKQMYLKTGFEVAKRTMAQIKGPTATHMASGRCLPIIADIAKTGTAIIGVSGQENLEALNAECRNKLSILGNLNGIEMRRWRPDQAEAEVKNAISRAGSGGGFILSDNHGEIPWQVPDEVLMAISEAVHKWGRYPLDWTKPDEAVKG